MNEAQLIAAVRKAVNVEVREAVMRAVAPLVSEVESLRNEVLQLRETLGERALTLTELSHICGRSVNTLYRRIQDRSLPAASTRPYRVLYSEYRRAVEEGRL